MSGIEIYDTSGELVFDSSTDIPLKEMRRVEAHSFTVKKGSSYSVITMKVNIPVGGRFLILGNIWGRAPPSTSAYEMVLEFNARHEGKGFDINNIESWKKYVGNYVVQVI